MSVYNKTPYIVSVLSSLTQELQNALQVLIDTKNEPKLYSLINDDYKITTDDKGVNFVQLECKDKVITGYLVYNNTYCVIFGFNASQKVEIYNVDYANRKAEKVEEECSILEFRAVLEHLSLAASGGLKREIVETLPTEDIDTNTIYMVLATVPSANNYYIEYMYIGDAWEIIGSTATIDEIHYFDKEPVNGEFTVSSDEWTEAMNYDASMVQIKVGTDYYCLWKTKYDAATVYFEGVFNGVEHQAIFLKDGSNYSGSYVTINSVEANVTIPSGAVVNELQNLRINNNYFNIDKPIHFIKLTSDTITNELRNEILSDDYFVIIEYSNYYYYEKTKTNYNKTFESLMTGTPTGTNGFNGAISISYNYFTISNATTTITLYGTTIESIKSEKNVSYNNINSKISSSTNATSGKVLTADGEGGASWGNVSKLGYLTTAPTQDNTSGVLQIVVLSSDSGITKYNGYLYLITGA